MKGDEQLSSLQNSPGIGLSEINSAVNALYRFTPSKGEPTNVLLVEDSEDDRFFFGYAFNLANCHARLYTVQDGIEAIEFFKTEMQMAKRERFPDFVFLDLKMPECDGFDVLRWMKENSLFESTKVFVLSGSSEPQDIQLSRELGAQEYLVKPIRYPVLQRLLQAGEPSS